MFYAKASQGFALVQPLPYKTDTVCKNKNVCVIANVYVNDFSFVIYICFFITVIIEWFAFTRAK
jgi:hypothetical protein